LKNLAYHELRHASHYIQAGGSYWVDQIIAQTTAWFDTDFGFTHSNAQSFDADRIALAES